MRYIQLVDPAKMFRGGQIALDEFEIVEPNCTFKFLGAKLCSRDKKKKFNINLYPSKYFPLSFPSNKWL